MARVSTYLNFLGNTAEAFAFYKTVFGGEYNAPIMYMKDAPPPPGMPSMPPEVGNLVMHVELTITGGHVIMATDAIESMGHKLLLGNNMSINLEPDTRVETKRLFDALSEGGSQVMPLSDMFWGSYFGTCVDKFGIRWMFNCAEKA